MTAHHPCPAPLFPPPRPTTPTHTPTQNLQRSTLDDHTPPRPGSPLTRPRPTTPTHTLTQHLRRSTLDDHCLSIDPQLTLSFHLGCSIAANKALVSHHQCPLQTTLIRHFVYHCNLLLISNWRKFNWIN